MLLTMKALNEGGRAFSSYVALQLDIAKFSDDEAARQRAEAQVALLTPVAKAFLTDMGLETTVHGQQVFGGHGFIREWGQEQLVRDCRITQIYGRHQRHPGAGPGRTQDCRQRRHHVSGVRR